MEKLLLESFESMYHSHITHLRSIVGRGCYVDSRVIDKITIKYSFFITAQFIKYDGRILYLLGY